MTKDNGGPAFPELNTEPSYRESGMTLRDYFAAKAMASMVNSLNYADGDWAQDDIAAQSYQMADAMLLERTK
jgi:hypothetical protein